MLSCCCCCCTAGDWAIAPAAAPWQPQHHETRLLTPIQTLLSHLRRNLKNTLQSLHKRHGDVPNVYDEILKLLTSTFLFSVRRQHACNEKLANMLQLAKSLTFADSRSPSVRSDASSVYRQQIHPRSLPNMAPVIGCLGRKVSGGCHAHSLLHSRPGLSQAQLTVVGGDGTS